MHVAVGFSEHQETDSGGMEAAQQALSRAGRSDPCDIVLLFATAWHDPFHLRSVVASVFGSAPLIVGGGSIGVMTNDRFGYAEDQIGLAAIWLDGVGVELLAKCGVVDREKEIGEHMGRRLIERGATADTPAMLFYDAVNRTRGDVRLNQATPILTGLEKGLGFTLRNLVGAGLQGDYDSSATMQWNGRDTVEQCALLMAFPGGLRIDSTIMHGCRPVGERYTVSKSEGQTLLEINGEPALSFIESRLRPTLSADDLPFFTIFGINCDPEGREDEQYFINRLVLAVDKQRNAVIMFEPDMVPGTRFQIMYRNLDLGYIPPKINALFDNLHGRRPVFSFYIDCAGRTARFGSEFEDAITVQQALADRTPFLGIYSGVEIAPILGRPRALDWTGVFCLFSVPE